MDHPGRTLFHKIVPDVKDRQEYLREVGNILDTTDRFFKIALSRLESAYVSRPLTASERGEFEGYLRTIW